MNWEQIWQSFENWLKPATDLVQAKPLYALLSILANIIQVGAFVYTVMTLRQSRKKEKEERALKEKQIQSNSKVEEQLFVYEEMFRKTKIAAKLEEELEGEISVIREKIQKADIEIDQRNLSIQERERIQSEKDQAIKQLEDERKKLLAQKVQDIKHFEERLQQVVAAAQNEALREVIKKRLEMLKRELDEINKLKAEYEVTDISLDLPEDVKSDLKTSFRELVPPKKEDFPQSYLLQMFFLILIIFFLPSPVDTFILLILLVPIFFLVIDGVKYLKNEKLTRSFKLGYRLILFITLYSLWVGIFSWIHSILQPFITQAYDFIVKAINSPQSSTFVTGCTDDFFNCLKSAQTYAIPFVLWMKAAKIALDIAPFALPLFTAILGYLGAIKPIRKKILEIENHENAK
jgi:hypothetical protein